VAANLLKNAYTLSPHRVQQSKSI